MKTTMRLKKLLVVIILALPTFAYAANEVQITVSGSGVDKETAIKTALRSALEQTYGTFVSTSTKIQNDELMSDEIVSLSRGNIQSYKILSENQLANGHWYVLLQAIVNINQLAKYVKGEGATVEVDMNAFNAKVLLEEMNAAAERKIIEHLIAELESMDNLWDYSIEVYEPRVSDEYYVIAGEVHIKPNNNTHTASNLIIKTLSELNVKEENQVKGKKYYNCDISCLPYVLRTDVLGDVFNKKFDVYKFFNSKISFIICPLNMQYVFKKVDNHWKSLWQFKSENGSITETVEVAGVFHEVRWSEYAFWEGFWRYLCALYKNSIWEDEFYIDFVTTITREEALKIKEITVQPINTSNNN